MMRYTFAQTILRNIPQCWSEASIAIKPAYAKQLLENNLIEEVEPGRFRATVLGTEYAASYSLGRVAIENTIHFTIEETDLPHIRVMEESWNKFDCTPLHTDKELHKFIGQPSIGNPSIVTEWTNSAIGTSKQTINHE
jgi:hypothetical protein